MEASKAARPSRAATTASRFIFCTRYASAALGLQRHGASKPRCTQPPVLVKNLVSCPQVRGGRTQGGAVAGEWWLAAAAHTPSGAAMVPAALAPWASTPPPGGAAPARPPARWSRTAREQLGVGVMVRGASRAAHWRAVAPLCARRRPATHRQGSSLKPRASLPPLGTPEGKSGGSQRPRPVRAARAPPAGRRSRCSAPAQRRAWRPRARSSAPASQVQRWRRRWKAAPAPCRGSPWLAACRPLGPPRCGRTATARPIASGWPRACTAGQPAWPRGIGSARR